MLDDPAIGGVVLNTRDVSDRHQAEMELAYRANHDALTDLANRPMFELRVEQVLARDDLNGFLPAVLILDLDDFKTINDSLGHVAGDTLLVEVGQRLRQCLRSVDLAARFGGDEFAVLLEGTRNRTEIETLARRLVDAISQPMMIEGRELEMQASVGIAIVDSFDHSAASLIRDADVAMYVAKDSGRAGYVVFDDSMSARASERLGLIADLRKAVERGQISLNYQSIISLESGRVNGLEALLRWDHPTRGWVSPARFIELAEETGQIQTLGAWVFNTALDEMTRLDASLGGDHEIHIAINVSMRQLEQANFAEFVAQALERTGFAAERVMIEITETALMRDPETMLRQLQLLKRLGVTIAIDDFGTGYSSLSYLAHLPIDIVKIDRSFVEGIGQSQRDTRIANMIMRIGDSLELDTVAEGVESYDQLAALQHIGCAMAQGFLFGKPAPMPEVAARFRARGLTVDLGDTPLLAT
jgi:diguanylate cyclase (GGDEF)-like protein